MSIQVPSAAQAIGEYLQSPDDLMKVAAFRKKLEKEKKVLEDEKKEMSIVRERLRKLNDEKAASTKINEVQVAQARLIEEMRQQLISLANLVEAERKDHAATKLMVG